MAHATLLCALLAALHASPPGEDELPRVLFLTHSAGFTHPVVKRPDDGSLALAEQRLVEAAEGRYRVEPTQDASLISAQSLAGYDAVVFYTTGELPVPAGGAEALLEWVRTGGAFLGIHCATDTFYEFAPYQQMIGGAFDGHPWHQEVTLLVEDPSHPAIAGLPERVTTTDEIYQHRDFSRHPVRVLLSLDPDSVDITLGKRADGDYAIAWARDWGQGRVYYTALGHRPEQWESDDFRDHVLDGIAWALDGPDHPARPPEGATILLGRGVAGDAVATPQTARLWQHEDGRPFAWRPVEGAVEVVAGAGDLVSKTTFGDVLLHVEFMTPRSPDGAAGQARGNSGVTIHGRYEVQVLDSFGVEQAGMGDCGAIYGIKVPDVDANRPPERWQAYDIRFQAPRFAADGTKSTPARMSVWHNGLLIHENVEVPRPTGGARGQQEAPTGPLLLQDHGNPVRYRNVWFVPIFQH